MRIALLVPLITAALAAPAFAKPSESSLRRMLFVAPNGKPFRGQPGQPYPSATWFAEADANHDGKLDKAEYKANFAAYFDTLDTDHDGEITPPELDNYETSILPETKMQGGGMAGYAYSQTPQTDDSGKVKPPPLRPGGAAFFNFFGAHQPLLSMDTNLNRGINQREYAAGAERTWKLLNPKGKPFIAVEDLPRTMAQR